MKRYLYALLPVTIAVFAACSSKPNNDQLTINYLSQHMEESMITINRSTETILAALQEKMMDPVSSERAKHLFPKATQIHEYSKEIIKRINEFKYPLLKYSDKDKATREKAILDQTSGKHLEDLIVSWYSGVAAVDSSVTEVFKDQLLISRQTLLDSLYKVSLLKNKISISNAIVLLSQFQNNIIILENRMIQFCNNKITSTILICDFPSAIVAINTEYTLASNKLEITAGMGYFNTRSKPIVTIAGHLVEIDEDGAAHYKFKAASQPGKHKMPVKIQFINDDGKQEIIEKVVEYTVAKQD